MKEKTETNKPTVGKLATDLSSKKQETGITPNEYTKEILSDYGKNLEECVESNKKKLMSDFFVVVLTKKERLLKNVLRSYFFARISCPTPDYDQAVYHYKLKDDAVELVWIIPDRLTCRHMIKNKALVDPSQWDLLSFILKFEDETLYKLAKKLNGEKENTPELKGN